MAETTVGIERWLLGAGLAGRSEVELLGGLSEQLLAAGVPLIRSVAALDILHPIVGGRQAIWERVRHAAVETEYPRYVEEPEDWLTSPLYVLDESTETRMRWDLDEVAAGRFPLLDRLRAEGGREYLAFKIAFDDPAALGTAEELFTSWSSDARFSEADIAMIETVLPAFALALKSVATARAARSLLATYLGEDAAMRVCRGEIERGQTRTLRAVLWFSDLKGFTKIADQAGAEQLVPLLNAYSDCLVRSIHDHDGQVLKFMGDGLLGTFHLDRGSGCSRALDAVVEARRAVAELNRQRTHENLPVAEVDFALHIGDVLYGNIGSRDRLDFTVVGPAVNEASRLEAMADALDQRVIVSEAFANNEPACRARLVSLGRYMLRGVRRPQELFTLDPDQLGSN